MTPTLILLVLAFAYAITVGFLRLNDVQPTRYRHAMHRAHPQRRTVPDDWSPLDGWVRVRLAPTVHSSGNVVSVRVARPGELS